MSPLFTSTTQKRTTYSVALKIIPILKSENSQYTDEDVAQNHGDLQQSRCFVA
jgi:hypothetical protein